MCFGLMDILLLKHWNSINHPVILQGAFTFREKMIDMPLLLQAKNIVELAENIRTEWQTIPALMRFAEV